MSIDPTDDVQESEATTNLQTSRSKSNGTKKQIKKESTERKPALWLREKFKDIRKTLELSIPPINQVIKEAVVVLDTNVLLMPFKLNKSSISDISAIYKELSNQDRLWASSHTLREFANNRGDHVKSIHQKLMNTKSGLKQISNLHIPLLEEHEELVGYNASIENMLENLEKAKRHLSSLLEDIRDWGWRDPVSELYRAVFPKDKIVEFDIQEQDLEKMRCDRFDRCIPPGYMDKTKADGGVGDLLIWLEVLEVGRKTGKPVLFVTDDSKHDWVERDSDVSLMPRAELLEEFVSATGNYVALASWGKLLQESNASAVTIKEVQKIDTERYRKNVTDTALLESLLCVLRSNVDLIKILTEGGHTFRDLMTSWSIFRENTRFFRSVLVNLPNLSDCFDEEDCLLIRNLAEEMFTTVSKVDEWIGGNVDEFSPDLYSPVETHEFPPELLSAIQHIQDSIHKIILG